MTTGVWVTSGGQRMTDGWQWAAASVCQMLGYARWMATLAGGRRAIDGGWSRWVVYGGQLYIMMMGDERWAMIAGDGWCIKMGGDNI